MSEDFFKDASTLAFSKVKDQILKEMTSEEFDWDLFSNFLLKDGTPLVHVFSVKSFRCAELYAAAKKMATIADDMLEEEK